MRRCMILDSWVSSTQVLFGQAKACIRVGWCTSLLGRASFCRSWSGEMQQSWYLNRQAQDQAGHNPRNELSVSQQQRKDVRREERKVCPPALGIKTAVPNNRRESKEVLKRMQKAVWSGTLNIARTFKVVTWKKDDWLYFPTIFLNLA